MHKANLQFPSEEEFFLLLLLVVSLHKIFIVLYQLGLLKSWKKIVIRVTIAPVVHMAVHISNQ